MWIRKFTRELRMIDTGTYVEPKGRFFALDMTFLQRKGRHGF